MASSLISLGNVNDDTVMTSIQLTRLTQAAAHSMQDRQYVGERFRKQGPLRTKIIPFAERSRTSSPKTIPHVPIGPALPKTRPDLRWSTSDLHYDKLQTCLESGYVAFNLYSYRPSCRSKACLKEHVPGRSLQQQALGSELLAHPEMAVSLQPAALIQP
ncbi:hypothetical protein BDR22DRAFT_863811 [Usnea florida]